MFYVHIFSRSYSWQVIFIKLHSITCWSSLGGYQASDDLGPGAEEGKLIAHAVKINVFHSIEFLLKNSEALRELVKGGFSALQVL